MGSIEGKNLLLSVDPGDSTGVAVMDFDTCEVLKLKIFNITEFSTFLRELNPKQIKVIVVENFILYQNKAAAQTGSRFKAVQIIGMLQLYADMNKIKYVKQPANILANAYKIAGIRRESNHAKSHHRDALVHAAAYFVGIGRRLPEYEATT